MNATLYRANSDAIGDVRSGCSVPKSVVDDAVVKWAIANSNDRVVVDCDEI
ncbi:hypothetical protein [Mycolicibacterium sp.]|uniref:hypothetical protein n=1 Tax=Mycolicibacterium sp. TaxID=2320850 RepID=UPI0037CAE977